MINAATTFQPNGARDTSVQGSYTPRDDSALYQYVTNRLDQMRQAKNYQNAPPPSGGIMRSAPVAAPVSAPAFGQAGPEDAASREEAYARIAAAKAATARAEAMTGRAPMKWVPGGPGSTGGRYEMDDQAMTGAQRQMFLPQNAGFGGMMPSVPSAGADLYKDRLERAALPPASADSRANWYPSAPKERT